MSRRRYIAEHMPHRPNERDDPRFLNYLFLGSLLEICQQAGVPKDVQKTIEQVMDLHAYDISPKLRREAVSVSKDFAEEILDVFETNHQDYRSSKRNVWNDALVSSEQAMANKALWEQAMEKAQRLEIHYVSDTSGYAVRKVKPTGIRGPYGEGYCYLRNADRVFRFDRILELAVMR